MQELISAHAPLARTSPPLRSRKLSNSAINFIVDAALLVSFMSVLTAAAIVQIVFPGPGSANGWTLCGLHLEGWMKVLSGTLAVFGLLVLLHLILHWSWVCSFVTSRLSKATNRRIVMDDSAKTIWGVALLIAVLTIMGAAVAVGEFLIQSPR